MFVLFYLISGVSGVTSGVSGAIGIVSGVVLNSINRIISYYELSKFYKEINSCPLLLLLFFSIIVTVASKLGSWVKTKVSCENCVGKLW